MFWGLYKTRTNICKFKPYACSLLLHRLIGDDITGNLQHLLPRIYSRESALRRWWICRYLPTTALRNNVASSDNLNYILISRLEFSTTGFSFFHLVRWNTLFKDTSDLIYARPTNTPNDSAPTYWTPLPTARDSTRALHAIYRAESRSSRTTPLIKMRHRMKDVWQSPYAPLTRLKERLIQAILYLKPHGPLTRHHIAEIISIQPLHKRRLRKQSNTLLAAAVVGDESTPEDVSTTAAVIPKTSNTIDTPLILSTDDDSLEDRVGMNRCLLQKNFSICD